LRKLGVLALAALPLLTGCLQFDHGNTLTWSPTGKRLAFIAAGKAWVYDLENGAMSALPSRREPSGVAWSPRENLIATSTAGLVETFVEDSGVFFSSAAYVMPFLGSDAVSLLQWHPQEAKLIDAQLGSKGAETSEIDLSAKKASKLGPGIGIYGARGEWLLWGAQAPIGRSEDKVVFDRQSPSGQTLPLPHEAVRVLDAGFIDALTTVQDHTSRQPICARREDPQRGRTDFYCLDDEGEPRRRASLPLLGNIFPDVRRRLFAVLEEKREQEPTLSIYDGEGRLRAKADKFMKQARLKAPGDDRSERVSRLAWSPDGNWIAWVVDGRLCLWNWRNDVVRVHAPPA
jgi:hypothetical protein